VEQRRRCRSDGQGSPDGKGHDTRVPGDDEPEREVRGRSSPPSDAVWRSRRHDEPDGDQGETHHAHTEGSMTKRHQKPRSRSRSRSQATARSCRKERRRRWRRPFSRLCQSGRRSNSSGKIQNCTGNWLRWCGPHKDGNIGVQNGDDKRVYCSPSAVEVSRKGEDSGRSRPSRHRARGRDGTSRATRKEETRDMKSFFVASF